MFSKLFFVVSVCLFSTQTFAQGCPGQVITNGATGQRTCDVGYQVYILKQEASGYGGGSQASVFPQQRRAFCPDGGQLVDGPAGPLCRYSGDRSVLSGFATQHVECSVADRVGSAVVNSVAGALIGAAIDKLGHTGGTYTGAGAALGAARGLTMTCTALVRQETVQVSRRAGVAEGSDQISAAGRSSTPTSTEAGSSCKDDNGPVLTGYACAAYQRVQRNQAKLELPNGGSCTVFGVYYGQLNGECVAIRQWLNARSGAAAPIHMNDRVPEVRTAEPTKNASGDTCFLRSSKTGLIVYDFLENGSSNPLGKPVETGNECKAAKSRYQNG